MQKKVAIIGAGISGLLACKHAMEKGFNPVVFEGKSRIGGVWGQTIESTKLQTPKRLYQFSDFGWPDSVKDTFPNHNEVMDYLEAYAIHFNIFPRIKFNTKVLCIDCVAESEKDLLSGDLWGGTGEAFSTTSSTWNVTVQDSQDASARTEVYQVDFVILCIGKYSDLPNIPDFPMKKGPEVFDGEVLHSMEYASMDDDLAVKLIERKRVTVIGSQKSAVDLAAEVASINGVKHPCTLLMRTVHWTVPDYYVSQNVRRLSRLTELMVHKPDEGFFFWLIAVLLSPLLWIFSRLTELFLKWIYPLEKYDMVPSHGFLQQLFSCKVVALPANFYDIVREGGLVLKKSSSFSFCRDGLILDSDIDTHKTDIVVFATGCKSEEKLKNMFASTRFQKLIVASSAPFYRDCIHPRIPQLAILGYTDGPSILHATEIRSKWLSHFLAGSFKLPPVREMEKETIQWEKYTKKYAGNGYRRSCTSILLQIHRNDQLCRDMGLKPRRKKWLLAELFSSYGPADYRNMC